MSLLSSEAAFIFTAILLTIFILGFLGNVLVCFAIYCDKDLRQQISNIFLFNLAVTDLLTVVVVIPFCIAAILRGGWTFGEQWCQATAFVYYSLAIVGLETLALISWDRFYAVFYPLKYRINMTYKRVNVGLVFAWIWAVSFTIPCFWLGWFKYGAYESMCTYSFDGTGDTWKTQVITYCIFTILLCVVTPSGVMFACYCRVFSVVRRQRRKIAIASLTSKSSSSRNRRLAWRQYSSFKGYRTIILVAVFFILSWTPFCVTRLMKTVTWNHEFVPAPVDTFSTVLSLSSTGANPVVYGLFRKDFQRAFKRLLRQLCSH